jgi:putative phosphoribosyl transferase
MTTSHEELRFKDRKDAGRQLAQRLLCHKNTDAVIYALPRGGVVTGIEIARILNAPLDLIIPRKIGHPSNPEYAIGAVAEDGHLTANPAEIATVDEQWLRMEIERQQAEAKRRRETYLAGAQPIDIAGKTAIIVDDGIATGLTMKCAIKELKHRNPKKIIVAVSVAPADSLAEIEVLVDEVICLSTPEFMGAIGAFYDSFPQVEDAEVVRLMQSLHTSNELTS